MPDNSCSVLGWTATVDKVMGQVCNLLSVSARCSNARTARLSIAGYEHLGGGWHVILQAVRADAHTAQLQHGPPPLLRLQQRVLQLYVAVNHALRARTQNICTQRTNRSTGNRRTGIKRGKACAPALLMEI